MSTYLDTSFLLKIYVYEPESFEAQVELAAQEDRVINSLTDVEVASALFRRLDSSTAQQAYAAYRRDRDNKLYRKVILSEKTFEHARTLGEQYRERCFCDPWIFCTSPQRCSNMRTLWVPTIVTLPLPQRI